jgi:ABC-type Zn2+ transport system substrate-binding protein/surface adhesin
MTLSMHIKPNKSWGLLGLGVLLGASAAYAAASERYDTAVEGIDRANTMLTAIGTGTEKAGAKFQRQRALKALERAKLRIACAKEIENSSSRKRGCPAAMKDRFDDNDDEKDDDHDHGHDHDHDHKGDKDKGKKDKDHPKPKN